MVDEERTAAPDMSSTRPGSAPASVLDETSADQLSIRDFTMLGKRSGEPKWLAHWHSPNTGAGLESVEIPMPCVCLSSQAWQGRIRYCHARVEE